jgi:peptidoglycan hydrolase-like protein with peptidoglycan-binding domain
MIGITMIGQFPLIPLPIYEIKVFLPRNVTQKSSFTELPQPGNKSFSPRPGKESQASQATAIGQGVSAIDIRFRSKTAVEDECSC